MDKNVGVVFYLFIFRCWFLFTMTMTMTMTKHYALLLLCQLKLCELNDHFYFFQKSLACQLVACFEFSLVRNLRMIERLLHFRDSVKLPFTVNFSFNVIDLLFCWHEAVLHPL